MPKTRTPKAISLFSGCGGSDYALEKLGYQIIWANDIWQTACDTYKENLNNPRIKCGDIRDFQTFPHADLLVGCYPCQGYTQGCKRNWKGDYRNYILRECYCVHHNLQLIGFFVTTYTGMDSNN